MIPKWTLKDKNNKILACSNSVKKSLTRKQKFDIVMELINNSLIDRDLALRALTIGEMPNDSSRNPTS